MFSPSSLQSAQTYLTLQELGTRDPASASDGPRISPQSLALEYYQGLQQGAATSAAYRKVATNAAGSKAWAEFSQWMAARASILGRGPWDATPQDLVVYMETHWLPRHGELMLSDQQLHASPGYVRGILSHLSSIYKLAGKETAWDDRTQVRSLGLARNVCILLGLHRCRGRPYMQLKGSQWHGLLQPLHKQWMMCVQHGNPCRAGSLKRWKTGYGQRMRALGYAETSAQHVQFEQLDALLLGMEQDISQQLPTLDWSDPRSYMPVLLLQRDATGICCMWGSACRGDNACRLSLEELQDVDGHPLHPLLQQQPFPFAAGFQWQLAPIGTKTRQSRRAGVLRMAVLPLAEAHLDLLRHVHLLLQASQTAAC